MRDYRFSVHNGTAMHTATLATFGIDSAGTVRVIDKGRACNKDIGWITQAALAEFAADMRRTISGRFIPA
jgi:hypothetical protein